MTTETKQRPIRVKCLAGGYAICVDDLCHGVDTTMCGLYVGYDVCHHDYIPETCPECIREDDDGD